MVLMYRELLSISLTISLTEAIIGSCSKLTVYMKQQIAAPNLRRFDGPRNGSVPSSVG